MKLITQINKMKKLYLPVFIILISMTIQSQKIDLNQQLPENPKFVKGTLKNGLTYYIYSTDVVKDAASYYIISNAGSILESDDQSGLAHFLEHMAFNGTKNFPGKGILNTVQKYGAVFGKDINAHTAFDETVYNMNNIPTKDNMIETSLLILHDWANEISLLDDEIDAERGVIKEEWRTRRSAQMRILEKYLPTMFVNTKYAKRLPIGSMDVVENFEHKALRKFYHDWYRTDLQAIAIIGDVVTKEVEQKIRKIFSSIPTIKNPKKRYDVTIPENMEMLYFMGLDKEISSSNIRFNIHSLKPLENRNVDYLKKNLLKNLALRILNDRFKELIQKSDSPLIYTNLGINSLSRTENNMTLMIGPKPNKQYEAFGEALRELNRAVRFGFTKTEVDRAILSLKKGYEMKISQMDDIPHVLIEGTIQSNYLENTVLSDLKGEYEIAKKLFDQFTTTDIQNRLKELYTQKNRVLLVTGVEGNKNLTKNDAIKIIKKAETDKTLKPYEDTFNGKSLISDIAIKPGKILSEKRVDEIDATLFELSNGVHVYHKFVNKEKNSVQLIADSDGGFSLIKDADLPSANNVTSLADLSGIANYKGSDLMKILAGKTASSSLRINNINELVMGSSNTKDVETMLQLTYLRFVKPRFDEDSFKVMIHNLENQRIESSKNIQVQFSDSISIALYGSNHPKKRLFDEKYIKDISFEKIQMIYKERFKDPSDFKFFIVGDVKKEQLKPLLEKYIASIPTYNTKEEWKDNYVPWVKDQIKENFYFKMETPKSSVQIGYTKEMKWSLKNKILLNAFKDILQLRLTATLREEEGGTYGAVVLGMFDKKPREMTRIIVIFDCNPDMTEKLISIVYKEIDKIKRGDIKQEDLTKTLTNYIKTEQESKEKNTFYMDQVYTYVKEGYNVDDPKNATDIVNSITTKDVRDFTKKLFENSKHFELVMKPKK